MKRTLLLLVLFVCANASFAAEKASQYSALKALKTASATVPQNVQNQVVRITGENGSLHPITWQIYYYDQSADMDLRVITVSRGEVITNEEPWAVFDNVNLASCINLRDVKLDSKQVINVIHKLCYENKIGVWFIDCTLEKLQKGSVTPLWELVLKNRRNNAIGTIWVSAKTGKILKTEDLELTPESKLRAEKGFGQSFVDTFLGIGGKIEEGITGERTVDD
jgi:hypothetical protein